MGKQNLEIAIIQKDALVEAYLAIDKMAELTVRGALRETAIDTKEFGPNLSQRQYDDADPRMISSHNYCMIGTIFMDRDGQSTKPEHRERLRLYGYELMGYNSALGAIRQAWRDSHNRSIKDFTRKSVVGAGYRVGASFLMDAVYLTAAGAVGYLAQKSGVMDSVAHATTDFLKNLDAGKLARVATFVVGINFADYKWDITNKIDNLSRRALEGIKRKRR